VPAKVCGSLGPFCCEFWRREGFYREFSTMCDASRKPFLVILSQNTSGKDRACSPAGHTNVGLPVISWLGQANRKKRSPPIYPRPNIFC
jgi:hypothetical protein